MPLPSPSSPAPKLDEASGIMALMRGIGGSVGIAIVSWLLVREAEINGETLLDHVNPFNPAVSDYLSSLMLQGFGPRSPGTLALLTQEIGRQAKMLAFNDLFWFLGWFSLAMLPLSVLMRRPTKTDLVIT
jgi:DHA2 family multidrug resistance protein